MEDCNQNDEVMSTWSGSIYGVLSAIPTEVWNFVTAKAKLGTEKRYNKLKEYRKCYNIQQTQYHNIDTFITKLHDCIREEEAFRRNNVAKLLWYKYLLVTDYDLSLFCKFCNKPKKFTAYKGLFVHLRTAHSLILEEKFIDCPEMDILRDAFDRVNFKNAVKEEMLAELLNLAKAKFTAPEKTNFELIQEQKDVSGDNIDDDMETQTGDGDDEDKETEVAVENLLADTQGKEVEMDVAMTTSEESSVSTYEMMTHEDLTTVEVQDIVAPEANEQISDTNKNKPDYEESVVEDNKLDYEESVVEDNILDTSFAEELIHKTLNTPEVQETILLNTFDPTVFSKENITNLTYREKLPNSLIDAHSVANMTEVEAPRKSVVLAKPRPRSGAKSRKNNTTKMTDGKSKSKETIVNKKNRSKNTKENEDIEMGENIIGKKRKFQEVENSSVTNKKSRESTDECENSVKTTKTSKNGSTQNRNTKTASGVDKSSDTNGSEVTNAEDSKHSTTRPKGSTKRKSAKEAKEGSGQDSQVCTEEADIPISDDNGRSVKESREKEVKTRRNKRCTLKPNQLKRSRINSDERDTFLSAHILKSLQIKAKKRTFINPEHRDMYKTLINSIQESVSSKGSKKTLKSKNNNIYKKYINEYGKAKTRSDNRTALADVVNARIYGEHFSKKTGKANNPYKANVMLSQLENFKTYVNEQKISDTKLKMEETLKDTYKDHNNVTTWKEHLKSFSKIKTAKEYKTQYAALKHSCGKIPEVKNILTLIAPPGNERFKIIEKAGSTLMYEITIPEDGNLKGRDAKKVGTTEIKLLKNMVSQLIKGNSVSNLKYVLPDNGAQYIKWLDEYNKIKTSLNVSNNMKWFLNHVAHTIKDSSNPMSPLSKISMQELKRHVIAFSEYILVGQNISAKDMFTDSFFHNLTIFSMKFLYYIYDKILIAYKTNAFRSQLPNEFHMGMVSIFMKNEQYEDRFNPPSEMKAAYSTFMAKNGRPKVHFNGFMSTEKIANCLFHQRLISKEFDLKTLDDLIPYFESEDWRVIDLIESKCNMTVYDNLRSCLFVFLYNMVCNVLIDRDFSDNNEPLILSKGITWNFFKTCLFDSKYYEYGSIVNSVLHSFPTLNLTEEDKPPPPNTIVAVDAAPWFVVAEKYKTSLFSELFPSMCEKNNLETIPSEKVEEKVAATASRGYEISDDEDGDDEDGTNNNSSDEEASEGEEDEEEEEEGREERGEESEDMDTSDNDAVELSDSEESDSD